MEDSEQNNERTVFKNETIGTLENVIIEEDDPKTNSLSFIELLECNDAVKNLSEGCEPESREGVAHIELSDCESARTGKLILHSNNQVDQTNKKIFTPLCADYRSDSESGSVDSESDSSSSTSCTSSSNESENDVNDSSGPVKSDKTSKKKENKTDLPLSDLPPIDELKISVPEEECVEIGTITSIVETLVIVESYKGTAALDVDTVLFLECGKRTLGKIFDILGPVSEPVYTVRFNSNRQITELQIDKGMKIFYAPKTKHTSFVFISEIMKVRGSDASWKDNVEAPLEFQDFSDDEEERRFKSKGSRSIGSGEDFNESNSTSRKRPFPKSNQNSKLIQPSRFRTVENILNPQNQRFPNSHNIFRPAPTSAPNPPNTPHPSDNFFTYYPSPMSVPHPPFSAPPPYQYPPPRLPYFCFPPRFSGFPFQTFNPSFTGQVSNFQQPFYHQSNRRYSGSTWNPMIRIHSPPPPPPPPTS